MAKKIISYTISFLLTVLLLVFTLLQTINLTILNKKYINNKINSSNYYTELSEIINDKFKNYIMQSGMEEKVFENLFTEEKLKNDFKKVLDSIYDNKTFEINTDEIKKQLDTNIEDYINENNIKMADADKQQIETFEEVIIQNYVSSIQYSNSAINYISKIVQLSNKYIKPVLYILFTMIVVLIVTLVLINKKEIKIVLSYIGITLLSIGCLILIGLIFEKVNLNLENAIIIDKAISILIQLFITDLFSILYKINIVSIITGIIFIIYNPRQKNS